MSKVLSPEQVRQWEEYGYIAPLPVMSPGEISSFRKRLETLEERHPDADRKMHCAANVLAPWLYDLTCHSSLLDIVEDLLGPNILCLTSDYRFKNPGDDSCTPVGTRTNAMPAMNPCGSPGGSRSAIARKRMGVSG